MNNRHFNVLVLLVLLLGSICFLASCGTKAEETPKQEKKDTIGEIKGPAVISHDDLKRLYNWNGESGISELSDNASMVRIREGSEVEFHCRDMAVGNLQFWGSFVWAAKEVRIQQGRMVYPPTSVSPSLPVRDAEKLKHNLEKFKSYGIDGGWIHEKIE